jgi:L-iditol 2-dehydrogenase
VGNSVLVIGAGPIGCLHISIARARGATVFVSQRSRKRREMARLFQPDAVIDPSTEDVVARVRQLTDGRGVDVAICANGVGATQETAVESVRKGGRVVLFGGLPRSDPMTTLDSNRIHYGEIQVVGSFSYHPTFHRLALDVIARQLVPADLLISHTYPLQHIREAFDTAASRAGLKVMVSV